MRPSMPSLFSLSPTRLGEERGVQTALLRIREAIELAERIGQKTRHLRRAREHFDLAEYIVTKLKMVASRLFYLPASGEADAPGARLADMSTLSAFNRCFSAAEEHMKQSNYHLSLHLTPSLGPCHDPDAEPISPIKVPPTVVAMQDFVKVDPSPPIKAKVEAILGLFEDLDSEIAIFLASKDKTKYLNQAFIYLSNACRMILSLQAIDKPTYSHVLERLNIIEDYMKLAKTNFDGHLGAKSLASSPRPCHSPGEEPVALLTHRLVTEEAFSKAIEACENMMSWDAKYGLKAGVAAGSDEAPKSPAP